MQNSFKNQNVSAKKTSVVAGVAKDLKIILLAIYRINTFLNTSPNAFVLSGVTKIKINCEGCYYNLHLFSNTPNEWRHFLWSYSVRVHQNSLKNEIFLVYSFLAFIVFSQLDSYVAVRNSDLCSGLQSSFDENETCHYSMQNKWYTYFLSSKDLGISVKENNITFIKKKTYVQLKISFTELRDQFYLSAFKILGWHLINEARRFLNLHNVMPL